MYIYTQWFLVTSILSNWRSVPGCPGTRVLAMNPNPTKALPCYCPLTAVSFFQVAKCFAACGVIDITLIKVLFSTLSSKFVPCGVLCTTFLHTPMKSSPEKLWNARGLTMLTPMSIDTWWKMCNFGITRKWSRLWAAATWAANTKSWQHCSPRSRSSIACSLVRYRGSLSDVFCHSAKLHL